jgi:hypothetical protein
VLSGKKILNEAKNHNKTITNRNIKNENGDIKFSTHGAFMGITFIRYPQYRSIGKPINLKVDAIKTK